MKKGFYTIMAAQFFSSFADNALLIAAIALLIENHADDWVHPLLKLFFVFSYVVLAPFVGAFADSMPKGRVMFITNTIKIFGCILLFATIHPLLSYAVIGFGAAAYSPAKYGILTELLPPEKLVVANGWIETLTVSSIILGTVVGGLLISPHISTILIDIVSPLGIHSKADAAILVITGFYLLAALFNLRIPDTGFRYPPQEHGAIRLIKDFRHCCFTLWRDKLGQISLALTTLLWGAGATFQFIILEWAKNALNMPLNQAAVLQGVFALGIAVGAICAARYIPLKKSLSVMPAGILMAAFVMCMPLVHNVWLTYATLIVIGFFAGYFVVPMNALLQHRGHVLLSAGHSIAVQNFNENLAILCMLALYTGLVKLSVPVNYTIIAFSFMVIAIVALVMYRHQLNQKQFDSVGLIGQDPTHPV